MTNSLIHLTNQLPANHVVNSSTFSATWSPNRTIQASSIRFQLSVTESNLYHQGKLQMHPLGKTSQSPSFATRRCLAESHPWPVNVTAFTKFGDVRKENECLQEPYHTNKQMSYTQKFNDCKSGWCIAPVQHKFSMNKTIQKLKGFSVEPKTHNYGPFQTKTRDTYTSKCHHGESTSVLDQWEYTTKCNVDQTCWGFRIQANKLGFWMIPSVPLLGHSSRFKKA